MYSEDELFTITDLKQYIYCPRILYYHACLPDIRPVTYTMEKGISAHEKERGKAKRRSLGMYEDVEGERRFDLSLQSPALGLSGRLDEVIDTGETLIPVDYKHTRRMGEHFKLQIAAYALLIESALGLKVPYGYLYLIPARKTEQVKITPALRQKVQAALHDMRQIANTERMPPPTKVRQKCPGCEFRRFCNDV